MIVIASLRYRLPIEPFLIVMAAAPAYQLLLKIKTQRQRHKPRAEPT
jgi:hypothetical protein